MLGDHDTNKKEGEERGINICGMKVHPNYTSTKILHDVALLELCKIVKFSPAIQPISLAPKGFKVPDSYPLTVAGWGVTEESGNLSKVLRKVTVSSINRDTCKKTYDWITAGQICAGVLEGGKDSCQGDSGGSLWYKKNGINYQVGVVSSGRGCARPNAPGVYTNIAHYHPWIEKSLAIKMDPNFMSQLPSGLISILSGILSSDD